MKPIHDKKYGWWGKFHRFFSKNPRMIWIGPMSKEEMLVDYHEFRHNFKSQDVEEDEGAAPRKEEKLDLAEIAIKR